MLSDIRKERFYKFVLHAKRKRVCKGTVCAKLVAVGLLVLLQEV